MIEATEKRSFSLHLSLGMMASNGRAKMGCDPRE
jgi:hypothetical protein